MKKFAAVLAALMLHGCAVTVKPDPSLVSGAKLEPGPQSFYPVTMQWYATHDFAELQELCAGVKKNKRDFAFGCAMWDANTCIFFTNSETSYAVIGHEARHCFNDWWRGPFHK